MARRYLAGIIAGVITGGTGLAGLSLMTGLPDIAAPVVSVVPAVPVVPATENASAVEGADPSALPDTGGSAPDPLAQPGSQAAPQPATGSQAVPQISAGTGGLTAPEAADQNSGLVEVTPLRPPSTRIGAPTGPFAPESDTGEQVAALPANGGAPDPGPQIAPASPATAAASDGTTAGAGTGVRFVQVEAPAAIGSVPGVQPGAPIGAGTSPAAVGAPPPAPLPSEPDSDAQSGSGSENPDAGVAEDGAAAWQNTPVAQAPGLGTPVIRFTDRNKIVAGRQLPSVTGPDNSASGAGEGDSAASGADFGLGASGASGALARNSIAFENPDANPLYAIVLIDDGTDPDARRMAQALPFPVSVVVDAANPRAGADAAGWRAAGSEVLLRLSLPADAGPRDIETGVLSAAAAVPDAVAIFDQPETAAPAGRDAAAQLAQALAETGHGLVLYSRGLNTSRQLATREGVPNALVFRSFDDDGQSIPVMRRMLDRAGFRAEQEGTVIMVGHLRADTIRAIAEWSIDDRATGITLAPISAVLSPRRSGNHNEQGPSAVTSPQAASPALTVVPARRTRRSDPQY